MEYIDKMLEADNCRLDRKSVENFLKKQELIEYIYRKEGKKWSKSKLNSMPKSQLCEIYAKLKGYKLVDAVKNKNVPKKK